MLIIMNCKYNKIQTAIVRPSSLKRNALGGNILFARMLRVDQTFEAKEKDHAKPGTKG